MIDKNALLDELYVIKNGAVASQAGLMYFTDSVGRVIADLKELARQNDLEYTLKSIKSNQEVVDWAQDALRNREFFDVVNLLKRTDELKDYQAYDEDDDSFFEISPEYLLEIIDNMISEVNAR